MALLVYKISDYHTTHEREQYRVICQNLQVAYGHDKEWSVFIANLNLGDIELDGLIIKKDAIICIEFKKHGGEICAYENNDWTANGDIIKGGSGKTVFQQARLNRTLTRKGLRTETSLDEKQTKDIAGIIVFNNSIKKLDNCLSEIAKCWLHITDNEHFIEKVQDITTEKLYIELEDCLKIIQELHIPEECIDRQYSNTSMLSYKNESQGQEEHIITTFSKITHENGMLSDTAYLNELKKLTIPSFELLYNISLQTLEEEKRISPWLGLQHGVKVLENDDELARYMIAYGKMHKEKIDRALESISSPQVLFSQPLTIIDWGCGQGLATICFLDYLKESKCTSDIQNVVLIEPSLPALSRAIANIDQYGYHNVNYVNKYINDLTSDDIPLMKNGLVVHFFSNILDIDTVDLVKLHNLIVDNIQTEQLFICVGPQNLGATRISDFANLFDISDENLLAKYEGYLSSKRTINMLTFKIPSIVENIRTPEIIKVEYQVHRSRQTVQTSHVHSILSNEYPNQSLHSRAIQFYRLLVELERHKSSDAKDSYRYLFNEDNSSDVTKIQIDIEQNADFLKEFNQNHYTQWPKNLYIGIDFVLEDKIYHLFQYVYAYNDIKDIDVTKNLVSIPLCDFFFNLTAADELNITGEMADTIESIISQPSISLSELEVVIKDAVNNNISLDGSLRLALTSETPTLSQIHAELSDLEVCTHADLLSNFLQGTLLNNTYSNVYEEELIHVVDMDSHQRKAIQKAFNSRIAVITGPPGTGKTQMILNLLANALVKGKSVLLASKNNKAVDNVKERYDAYENEGYLLRFGSKDVVQNQIIPYLEQLINKISSISYSKQEYENVLSEYKQACGVIKESKRQLTKMLGLEKNLQQLNYNKEALISRLEDVQDDYYENKHILSTQYKHIQDFDKNHTLWNDINKDINSLLTEIIQPRNIVVNILFRIFKLSTCVKKVIATFGLLPSNVQKIILDEFEMRIEDISNINQIELLCRQIEFYSYEVLRYHLNLNQIENNYNNEYNRINKEIENIVKKIEQCKAELSILNSKVKVFADTILNASNVIDEIGESVFKQEVLSSILKPSTPRNITLYKTYLPDKKPWKDEDKKTYQEIVKRFIGTFRLNSVTSLSIKNSFPLKEELFDMVIIDEASQCDVASALPLIQRAKQLVVVGDPLQLKHISSANIDEERVIKDWLSLDENPILRYVHYSLYDYCNDLIATCSDRPVFLNSHYRSHPNIIEYSNQMFYQRRLQKRLEILTVERHPELQEHGIKWIDVVGEQKNTRNINELEIEECFNLATKLVNKYPTITIGIISPFKHQVEALKSRFEEIDESRIRIDTVHKFQGDECDVIIYSLMVTNDSPNSKIWWIDKGEPNLVNVAVTRARSMLYIIGNKEYIRSHSDKSSPLGFLLSYTEQLKN